MVKLLQPCQRLWAWKGVVTFIYTISKVIFLEFVFPYIAREFVSFYFIFNPLVDTFAGAPQSVRQKEIFWLKIEKESVEQSRVERKKASSTVFFRIHLLWLLLMIIRAWTTALMKLSYTVFEKSCLFSACTQSFRGKGIARQKISIYCIIWRYSAAFAIKMLLLSIGNRCFDAEILHNFILSVCRQDTENMTSGSMMYACVYIFF